MENERKRLMEEEWNSMIPTDHKLCRADFPAKFLFGVATSAYQVEGAASEGGKGPSIWDAFAHTKGKIFDGKDGDIAVDQYHRYKEDVNLIAKLGFSAYRFSISWSHIYPDGLGTQVNYEGIMYYNNLINYLLEKGIEPCVTLYHWDLPLYLNDSMGGWLSDSIVKYFAIYAETCFASFGDRVKKWITINEPLETAVNGYSTGLFAPGRSDSHSAEPYLVAHHQLLAHAEAVSIYRTKFKDLQGGEIGLVVDCEWAEALTDKEEDIAAAARHVDFQLGWFLDPIFFGEYPISMQERVGDKLPVFSQKDKELLRNSVDFVGLNHYTSRFVSHSTNKDKSDYYSAQEGTRIATWKNGSIGEKAASPWLYVVPWGMWKNLNYIAQKYNNPPIYITENGMDDEDNVASPLRKMLDDKQRVAYFEGYLASVYLAIKDGVDVRGYFVWSMVDNFEWCFGYTKRFGLIYVDYINGLTRHPKSSAYWFLKFLKGEDEENGKDLTETYKHHMLSNFWI
ncbi:putative beta-glucosidase [Helianthus annuus]|nr:putative beta-glucosidase [Helianthus annuus]KAJ0821167.1 putative beta-glucosidase [Helianthus annuus]